MAFDRLYIVDKDTGEYLCLAKSSGTSWGVGNIELYNLFINTRKDVNRLIIGTENDEIFQKEWLNNSDKNFNTENKWEYF